MSFSTIPVAATFIRDIVLKHGSNQAIVSKKIDDSHFVINHQGREITVEVKAGSLKEGDAVLLKQTGDTIELLLVVLKNDHDSTQSSNNKDIFKGVNQDKLVTLLEIIQLAGKKLTDLQQQDKLSKILTTFSAKNIDITQLIELKESLVKLLLENKHSEVKKILTDVNRELSHMINGTLRNQNSLSLEHGYESGVMRKSLSIPLNYKQDATFEFYNNKTELLNSLSNRVDHNILLNAIQSYYDKDYPIYLSINSNNQHKYVATILDKKQLLAEITQLLYEHDNFTSLRCVKESLLISLIEQKGTLNLKQIGTIEAFIKQIHDDVLSSIQKTIGGELILLKSISILLDFKNDITTKTTELLVTGIKSFVNANRNKIFLSPIARELSFGSAFEDILRDLLHISESTKEKTGIEYLIKNSGILTERLSDSSSVIGNQTNNEKMDANARVILLELISELTTKGSTEVSNDKKNEFIVNLHKMLLSHDLKTPTQLQLQNDLEYLKNPSQLANIFRKQVEQLLDRLDFAQLLARANDTGKAEPQLLSMPVYTGEEWTTIHMRFSKRRSASRKKRAADTCSVQITMELSFCGEIYATLDYDPKQKLIINIGVSNTIAREWLQKQHFLINTALNGMNLPSVKLHISDIPASIMSDADSVINMQQSSNAVDILG